MVGEVEKVGQIIGISKMTERGQVTIPSEIREREKLTSKDKFFVTNIFGSIIFTKTKESNIDRFVKIMEEVGKYVKYEDVRRMRREAEESSEKK